MSHTLLAGKYELLAVLGRGGMADVHLALSRGAAGFGKIVVVKELRQELTHDAEHVAMFLSEARLGARMAHPAVVQVFDAGREGHRYFIAMEHLDGHPLHRMLMKLGDGGLPLAIYLRLIAELLTGLHYAHDLTDHDGAPLCIVHRDVSPHNVFVTYDGHAKLVDFGIAKGMDSVVDTREGVVKGKAAYMSPEQASGDAVDRRADVYSAGVMIWEAVTGTRLFRGLNDATIISRLISGDIPSPRTLRPDTPWQLEAICMRAMAFEPSARYPTAEALRRDLTGAMSALGLDAAEDRIAALMSDTFATERRLLRETVAAKVKEARRRELDSMKPAPCGDVPLFQASTPLEFSTDARLPSEPPPAARTKSDRAQEIPTVPPPATLRKRRKRRAALVLAAGTLVLGAFGAFLVRQPGQGRTAVAATEGGKGHAHGRCDEPRKPLIELSGEIESDAVLTCDKNYLLKFNVFVRPGVTLTIEKGTTIEGDVDTKSALVVQPRARLVADGTADAPIVFTSERAPHDRRPGDWGGVILLGDAPTNLRDERGAPRRGNVEGLTSGGEYGGTDEDADSGVLRYVRIEYGGTELGPGNEINGLTLAGVGRKTVIDHVEVRDVTDDCFEFFGGTVDAKHLICVRGGDDGFDWDLGYRGRLQFLVFQQGPRAPNGANAFEGDNDPNSSLNEPRSGPTIFNATACGRGGDSSGEQYGLLARTRTAGRIANSVFTGFAAGIDVRDEGTAVLVEGTVSSGNTAHTVAYPEAAGELGAYADDDHGFDEASAFLHPERGNSTEAPGIADCSGEHPRLHAARARASAVAPPDDGFFDSTARFVGAVRDARDGWATEPWTAWTSEAAPTEPR